MILGWQGFSYQHPDDWALSRVTGNWSRGFLALTSSGSIACHVRWEPSGDPRSAAERYLKSLSTRKSKVEFAISEGEKVEWKRTGVTHGRGFAATLDDDRLVLLEVTGKAKDQLLPPLRSAEDSLQTGGLWSVFGLQAVLPEAYLLLKPEFLAAKTRLSFRAKGGTLVAERFGLAAQILEGTDLESWIQKGFPGIGELVSEENAVLLSRPGSGLRLAERVVAKHDQERNQIIVLSAKARRIELLPEWEWIPSSLPI